MQLKYVVNSKSILQTFLYFAVAYKIPADHLISVGQMDFILFHSYMQFRCTDLFVDMQTCEYTYCDITIPEVKFQVKTPNFALQRCCTQISGLTSICYTRLTNTIYSKPFHLFNLLWERMYCHQRFNLNFFQFIL